MLWGGCDPVPTSLARTRSAILDCGHTCVAHADVKSLCARLPICLIPLYRSDTYNFFACVGREPVMRNRQAGPRPRKRERYGRGEQRHANGHPQQRVPVLLLQAPSTAHRNLLRRAAVSRNAGLGTAAEYHGALSRICDPPFSADSPGDAFPAAGGKASTEALHVRTGAAGPPLLGSGCAFPVSVLRPEAPLRGQRTCGAASAQLPRRRPGQRGTWAGRQSPRQSELLNRTGQPVACHRHLSTGRAPGRRSTAAGTGPGTWLPYGLWPLRRRTLRSGPEGR